MKINLVPIGNSKGIRIPKAILNQCRIRKTLDLRVEGEQIILKPVQKNTREGWDKAFKDMHARGEDTLLINDKIDLPMKEWEW